MEESQLPEAESQASEKACANCGSPNPLPDYPNNLCADCREKFIKYPVPLWIKLFGAGIILIMLVSAFWLPGNLGAAIALERGKHAIKSHDYLTAQAELQKAQQHVSRSVEILSNLSIAAFYNGDFKTVETSSDTLEGKNIEDTAMYNRLTALINELRTYAPTDTFTKVFKNYEKNAIPDTALQNYIKRNPGDIYAQNALAASYMNDEKNALSDAVLSACLQIDHDYIPAIEMKTMVKRELNQPDSSLFYCNELLSMNRQSLFGLSSKARTFLKIGKLNDGLQVAQQCYSMDKTMPYNLATLAIAYHLTKNFKARDAIIRVAEKDSISAGYMSYAKDIISNKVKF